MILTLQFRRRTPEGAQRCVGQPEEGVVLVEGGGSSYGRIEQAANPAKEGRQHAHETCAYARPAVDPDP